MPVNFETLTGFYDAGGAFHPNTAITPSPIPGVNWTYPIDPSKDYDRLPNVMLPDYSGLIGSTWKGITDKVGELAKNAGKGATEGLALPLAYLIIGGLGILVGYIVSVKVIKVLFRWLK